MRRHLLLVAMAVGVLAMMATACSSGSGSAAPGTTQGTTATTAPTDPNAPAPTDGWRAWWVVDDHVAPGDLHPSTGGDDLTASIDALMAGPTPAEAAFGAGTGFSNAKGPVALNSLTVDADGVAHIDFNRKFETADTRPQTSQVVFTLTQFPQVKKVQFLIDGQPNGATGVFPIGRADVSFPGVG